MPQEIRTVTLQLTLPSSSFSNVYQRGSHKVCSALTHISTVPIAPDAFLQVHRPKQRINIKMPKSYCGKHAESKIRRAHL